MLHDTKRYMTNEIYQRCCVYRKCIRLIIGKDVTAGGYTLVCKII